MLSIGIDIGGSFVKAGLVETDTGQILTDMIMPFPAGQDSRQALQTIAEAIQPLIQAADSGKPNIGVAIPGSVDGKGVVMKAHNIGFHGVDVKGIMEELLPEHRISVMNDGNAAALAELKFGALKGIGTGVFVNIGTGVGGALIIGGEIFRGGGKGSEPGHMILQSGGLDCTCGNKGCAETLCSAIALKKMAKINMGRNTDSLLFKLCKEDFTKLNAELVLKCAAEGDPYSLRLIDDYTDSLSDLFASLASLTDPEIMVMGGGISQGGEVLFKPLNEKINNKVFFDGNYEVIPAKLGNKAGLLGAAKS